MTKLSNIIKEGDIVATDNIQGYEGAELGVYLGVETTSGEGLLYISWLGLNSRGLEKVFTSDFDKFFYPVRIYGLDKRKRVLYRKIKRKYNQTEKPIDAKNSSGVKPGYKKIK